MNLLDLTLNKFTIPIYINQHKTIYLRTISAKIE